MYDLKTATRLYVLEGHRKRTTACNFSPDGRRLVTLSLEECTVLVWKVGSSFAHTHDLFKLMSRYRIPKAHKDHLQSVYNSHMLNSATADPFKLALFRLMGKLDPTRRSIPLVTSTAEDWLWFQLAMVNTLPM